jgi:serine/threonine protein kinase
MTTRSILSLNSTGGRERLKDTIPCRIEFIKELLKNKKLDPLIDFDGSKSETRRDDASGGSYDTRVVLKKRCHDFSNIISQIGGKLKYIKSGTTGHTFKGEVVDNDGKFEYAVKVVAYPKKEKYGAPTDIRRPENAELMMIKLLSYFIVKKQTPHIVLPIGTFDTDISTFVNLIEDNVVDKDNDKYAEFIERYKKNGYHQNVSILISEWVDHGDLLDFIRQNYKFFTPMHWKVFFFQILAVLTVIQSKYPAFRHNDMKANNILVQKITKHNEMSKYRIERHTYKVQNIGYQIKLWDFDFACIPGYVANKKVEQSWTNAINVTPVQNRYYDIHYFFNTLIKKGFCYEIINSEYVPDEVREFINRVVPKKYQKEHVPEYIKKDKKAYEQYKFKVVHDRGRIMINDEYTTPGHILKNDPYFKEFRVSESITKPVLIKSKKTTKKSYLNKFFKSDSDEDKPLNPDVMLGNTD